MANDARDARPDPRPYQQDASSLLVSNEVNDYLEKLFATQSVRDARLGPVLSRMEALAKERGFPIIGPIVGPCLRMAAQLTGARRIFEFGSGFGYSAAWFASAFDGAGEVICTEGNAENVAMAEGFLSEAGLWDVVAYHQGWAQDIFKQQSGEFDIIYNDADKGDYPEIWALAKGRIRSGGLYIADNCLWGGRVAQQHVADDVKEGWTQAIQAHNHAIVSDPDFDAFMNPARDGVLIARRR